MKIDDVVKVVSKRYDVSEEEIVGEPKEGRVGDVQQIALFLVREGTVQSLLEIAKAFSRTHVAVIHGVKTISQKMETDAVFKAEVESTREELRAKCGSLRMA